MFIIQVIHSPPSILIKCTRTSLMNNNLHLGPFAGGYRQIYKFRFVSLVQDITPAKLSGTILGPTTWKIIQLISSYILMAENQHLQEF